MTNAKRQLTRLIKGHSTHTETSNKIHFHFCITANSVYIQGDTEKF